MTEDITPERIPFEEHPLYPLYKAGRVQWNRFMMEYLEQGEIIEISKRNPIMKGDFESASTLTDEQKERFNDYITREPTREEKEADDIIYSLNFKNCIFNDNTSFINHLFPNNTSFRNTKFSGWVYFKGAWFSEVIDFENAQFSKMADFKHAQFLDWVNFVRATFEQDIDFSNAKFKFSTYFIRVNFKQLVPQFHEAKLHQDTFFKNTIWPDNSRIHEEWILYANQSAYNRLVLEMNKQLRHDQELQFFAKELETKRHIHWKRRQLPSWLLNYLYYFASSYGRSIKQPIVLIFLSFMISFMFNCINYLDDIICKFSNLETVLRYTFLDFLPGGPLLQQRAVNALFKEAELCPPHILLDIVNSFASVVILAGFFLLGLGLRNRFRIR